MLRYNLSQIQAGQSARAATYDGSKLRRGRARAGQKGLTSGRHPAVLIAGVIAIASLALSVGLDAKVNRERKALNEAFERERSEETKLVKYVTASRELLRQDSLLTHRVNALRELDVGRFVWPHILAEIGTAVPEGLWISSISSSTGGLNPIVSVRGSALDPKKVGEFLNSLQESPFLVSPRFISADQQNAGSGFITSFSIEVRYQEPSDSTHMQFLELEPLQEDLVEARSGDELKLPDFRELTQPAKPEKKTP